MLLVKMQGTHVTVGEVEITPVGQNWGRAVKFKCTYLSTLNPIYLADTSTHMQKDKEKAIPAALKERQIRKHLHAHNRAQVK